MIVKKVSDAKSVEFREGNSLRFLLKEDGMGFTVNKTTIPKGAKGHWHYKNHLEACYCIKGGGILTNLNTGEKFTISPDTLYALDEHDPHIFEALYDTVLLSIFNPPLNGHETHKKDGSYELC